MELYASGSNFSEVPVSCCHFRLVAGYSLQVTATFSGISLSTVDVPLYNASTCSRLRPVAWLMDSIENRAAFKFLAIVKRSFSMPFSSP